MPKDPEQRTATDPTTELAAALEALHTSQHQSELQPVAASLDQFRTEMIEAARLAKAKPDQKMIKTRTTGQDQALTQVRLTRLSVSLLFGNLETGPQDHSPHRLAAFYSWQAVFFRVAAAICELAAQHRSHP